MSQDIPEEFRPQKVKKTAHPMYYVLKQREYLAKNKDLCNSRRRLVYCIEINGQKYVFDNIKQLPRCPKNRVNDVFPDAIKLF